MRSPPGFTGIDDFGPTVLAFKLRTSMISAANPQRRDFGRALSHQAGLTVTPRAPLARYTTLRIGGPAEWLAQAHTEEALAEVLAEARRQAVPFRVLGLGSNVLIPDGGLPGLVLQLTGELADWSIAGTQVEAGAGLPLARLARLTVDRGLVGLEALSGFPSTVGGAVVMNAGCYGVEIKDVLASATVLMPDGQRRVLEPAALGAGYRSTCLQGSDAIVVRASFQLQRGDASSARERMRQFNQKRWQSMPSGRPNAGSVFRNPSQDSAGRLLDSCGLKGRRCGDAGISQEHANVIVNLGSATAADVLDLMEIMHRSVLERFDIRLEPELILAGELRAQWDSRCA